MPKNTCSCGNDSEKKYKNEAETFRTHFHLDNAFIPIFQNPSRLLRDLVKNTNSVPLVDRANCGSCDSTVSTQEKLKVRKKDRPTPYRVPYNHFRKISSCKEDCTTNVKIIKDISCNPSDTDSCPKVNYAISRLVDKNGVRNINNGGNYKNYLQISGKTYYQNAAGILPENYVSGKIHTYKIGALENTVFNYNSGTQENSNCRLNYSSTTSLTEKSFTLSKINTTTKKYSNPSHRTSGSVSTRAHIHRKKFRNRLAGQAKGINGYNNCINGQLCTLYMAPGPNTKLFMGKTSKQRCIPPRIRGMKQTCTSQPPSCEANKYINPQFERESYITDEDAGYLKISIDHCPLIAGDVIEITFSGYPTTINTIFTTYNNANASSAITSAIYIGSNGNTNLTISNLFVNGNTIYWSMPVNVGAGTTQIILDDENNETNFITTNNGPTGTVYANVNIPRHISVTSSSAWNIFAPDPCAGRNGSFTQTSMILGYPNDPQPPYTVVTPSASLVHYVVMFEFTLSGDNLISGDVLQIAITTDYPAFFTGAAIGNNVNWSKNQRPNASSNPQAPSIWIQTDVSGNIIPGAIQSASVENTTINNVTSTYIQTLSATIGTTITNPSGTIRLGIFGNNDWLTTHPNGDYDVNYQISCNCWTSTGVLDGYSYQAPATLSNLSLIPSNFGGYNSANGLGGSDSFVNPVHTLDLDNSGDADPKAYVALKFTHQDALSSGDTIKLTIKKPIGTNTPQFAEPVFYTDASGNWGEEDSGLDYRQPVATTDGSTLTISSIFIGTYDETNDKQSVTITLGSSSDANSVIEIKYYDDGFNAWANSTEEGKEITFDLEVTDHATSSNNSGWFVQDISGDNLETTAGSKVFKGVIEDDDNGIYVNQGTVSNIIYRHYSAIPKDSYIYIYFSTTGGGFFDTPLDWGSYITNNALSNTISHSDFGISVREKDINNNSTDNDISLTDFVVDKFDDPVQDEYGNYDGPFIHYLRFKINENGGITGGTGKYIEIYINDAGNAQFMAWTGFLSVSVEVRSSTSTSDNSNLLGSVYEQNMGVQQT